MDDDIVVTEKMRQAVRRDECKMSGHEFDLVIAMSGDPTEVICHRCERRWPIDTSDGS